MIKILKKLIKTLNPSKKEYFVAYAISYIAGHYNYKYCDKEELLDLLEKYSYKNIHIFNSTDELEIDTKLDFGK